MTRINQEMNRQDHNSAVLPCQLMQTTSGLLPIASVIAQKYVVNSIEVMLLVIHATYAAWDMYMHANIYTSCRTACELV